MTLSACLMKQVGPASAARDSFLPPFGGHAWVYAKQHPAAVTARMTGLCVPVVA